MHLPIMYNQLLERAMDNTVTLCHRDAFLIDGSEPNSSVAAITRTKAGQYHDWRGPIVVYSNIGSGLDPRACKDMDMNDFRHVADYFRWYGYKPSPCPQETLGIGAMIPVIGHCYRDLALKGSESPPQILSSLRRVLLILWNALVVLCFLSVVLCSLGVALILWSALVFLFSFGVALFSFGVFLFYMTQG
ncbi:hypothetical protein GQ44DRAFT_715367, partial [Phaeosphaeriaceae sp. PMI808]